MRFAPLARKFDEVSRHHRFSYVSTILLVSMPHMFVDRYISKIVLGAWHGYFSDSGVPIQSLKWLKKADWEMGWTKPKTKSSCVESGHLPIRGRCPKRRKKDCLMCTADKIYLKRRWEIDIGGFFEPQWNHWHGWRVAGWKENQLKLIGQFCSIAKPTRHRHSYYGKLV